MSNLKLGKLQARIFVDDGFRPHFGPDDIITGHVVLVYYPYTSIFKKKSTGTADLFGPLNIEILLHGRVKLRIRRERSHALPTEHDMHLFARPFEVYDGSFKADLNEEYKFPFTATFPSVENAGLAALPPSLSDHFSDAPDIVDLAVQYRLGVKVEMPGIDIQTIVPLGESQSPVKYELPRPALALIESNRTTFKHRVKIQNQHLLPEDQQPQGFKQKAKAVFTSSHFPTFVLDIFCTDQQYIYPGQKLQFEVVLRRDDSETTAPAVPDISLEAFRVHLRGITRVDASGRLLGKNECYDKRILQNMQCRTRLPLQFSKANDYSHTLAVDPIMRHASSFVHLKLSRQYWLRITMQFTVAKKTVKFVREVPVVVVPPPEEVALENGEPPVEAGSSRIDLEESDEELPLYEEAPKYEEAEGEAGPSRRTKSEG